MCFVLGRVLDGFEKIEFIYNAVQLLFTWTSLANFYLAFFFVSLLLCLVLYLERSAHIDTLF